MIYLYKRNKTGICIDRVYGYDTIVELPDMLEGFPVTELGAYIFSDHIDSTELKMMQEKENFCTENGRATRPEDDMPQAAGNRVEEIRLLWKNAGPGCRSTYRLPQDGTDCGGDR